MNQCDNQMILQSLDFYSNECIGDYKITVAKKFTDFEIFSASLYFEQFFCIERLDLMCKKS